VRPFPLVLPVAVAVKVMVKAVEPLVLVALLRRLRRAFSLLLLPHNQPNLLPLRPSLQKSLRWVRIILLLTPFIGLNSIWILHLQVLRMMNPLLILPTRM